VKIQELKTFETTNWEQVCHWDKESELLCRMLNTKEHIYRNEWFSQGIISFAAIHQRSFFNEFIFYSWIIFGSM